MEKAIQHGVGQGDSNPDGDYFVKANYNTKKSCVLLHTTFPTTCSCNKKENDNHLPQGHVINNVNFLNRFTNYLS